MKPAPPVTNVRTRSDATERRRPRGLRYARRPLAGRVLRTLSRLLNRATIPLRRSYYLEGRGGAWIPRLPRSVGHRLGLDDPEAVGSRRIEIGGGPHAQPGYLHVDVDAGASHLEALAPAWSLPFEDDFADEILAIHSLEHVHPRRLLQTLREWRRVLAPDGHARVHVPNGPELMTAFTASDVEAKWGLMGSLLGMYCGPETHGPEDLTVRSDHQLILDFDLLRWAFSEAGFADVRDVTQSTTDRHIEAWHEVVPHYSLVVVASIAGRG
jgi:SAM-dependent methyltransferase